MISNQNKTLKQTKQAKQSKGHEADEGWEGYKGVGKAAAWLAGPPTQLTTSLNGHGFPVDTNFVMTIDTRYQNSKNLVQWSDD